MKTINILGTEYEYRSNDMSDELLLTHDGYCQIYDKTICVRKREYMDGRSDKAKAYRESHVLRHEIIHAIAEECGVSYGDNEDLVDWIAHIVPVVNKAVAQIEEMNADS